MQELALSKYMRHKRKIGSNCEPIFQMCMQEVKANYEQEPPQMLKRINSQMIELHPQPSEPLLKKLRPPPQPQPSLLKRDNRMMSQIRLQHPLLPEVSLVLPHPQFVADKSLIFYSLHILFYGLSYVDSRSRFPLNIKNCTIQYLVVEFSSCGLLYTIF